jgi:hypothetical protein
MYDTLLLLAEIRHNFLLTLLSSFSRLPRFADMIGLSRDTQPRTTARPCNMFQPFQQTHSSNLTTQRPATCPFRNLSTASGNCDHEYSVTCGLTSPRAQ